MWDRLQAAAFSFTVENFIPLLLTQELITDESGVEFKY